MYDPYRRDTPGLAEPANNLILLTPDDDNEIRLGCKWLRIFNPNEIVASVHVETAVGDTISFNVPPQSLWTEPLRIRKLLTATTSGLIIHGYTEWKDPAE